MAKIEMTGAGATFFSVLSDGKFHHSVEEGHQGATKREYELKDGTKGFKWEITANSIEGLISGISVRDGEFGKQLHIAFAGDANDDKTVVISLNLASNFAEDFLKKLPNIDTDKEVKLVPYSFEDEKTKKTKRGITVYQEDKKINGYYHEMKADKKSGKETLHAINGYPEVPKESKTWDSDDWKIYFTQARKFLVAQLEKHPLYNATYLKAMEEGNKVEYPKNEYPDAEISFDNL